ncbi:hypothetical protein BC830DRAFT_1164805 [Chytriomyces sp. MP71]|nr:hypothetical protein BC830DRAFT_1164805 [Chytriomyces sp. MP71]
MNGTSLSSPVPALVPSRRGRKRMPDDQVSHDPKATKNRNSQQIWRDRQKAYRLELEQQVEDLKRQLQQLREAQVSAGSNKKLAELDPSQRRRGGGGDGEGSVSAGEGDSSSSVSRNQSATPSTSRGNISSQTHSQLADLVLSNNATPAPFPADGRSTDVESISDDESPNTIHYQQLISIHAVNKTLMERLNAAELELNLYRALFNSPFPVLPDSNTATLSDIFQTTLLATTTPPPPLSDPVFFFSALDLHGPLAPNPLVILPLPMALQEALCAAKQGLFGARTRAHARRWWAGALVAQHRLMDACGVVERVRVLEALQDWDERHAQHQARVYEIIRVEEAVPDLPAMNNIVAFRKALMQIPSLREQEDLIRQYGVVGEGDDFPLRFLRNCTVFSQLKRLCKTRCERLQVQIALEVMRLADKPVMDYFYEKVEGKFVKLVEGE